MNKLPKIQTFTTLLDLGLTNTIDLFVYKLLALRKKYRQQITVDAVALNKRINKLCKQYSICDRTAIRALKRIAKAGLINIVYDVSGFGKYVIEVIPLNDFLDDENSNHSNETDSSNVVVAPNTVGSKDTGNKNNKECIDQQQLIYADQKCRAAGIKYKKKDLWKIAQYPQEAIKLAINAFKASEIAQNTHIWNPAGWLIRCLEEKYYLSYRPIKAVKSATQKLFELQDWFIENTGSIPQRIEQLDIFRQKKYEALTG